MISLKTFKRWKSIVGVIWGLFSARALWDIYYNGAEFWDAFTVWCFLMIVYISLRVTEAAFLELKQETEQVSLKLFRHIENSEGNRKS